MCYKREKYTASLLREHLISLDQTHPLSMLILKNVGWREGLLLYSLHLKEDSCSATEGFVFCLQISASGEDEAGTTAVMLTGRESWFHYPVVQGCVLCSADELHCTST